MRGPGESYSDVIMRVAAREQTYMPNGYAYSISVCDVPIERRPALQSFRDRRSDWMSWLHTDKIHSIWPTVHGMVWRDVALTALTAFSLGSEKNALHNPLLLDALVNGHIALQVLAIRRLIEDTPKERISLRKLLKDIKRHIDLFTRENYVCCDGTPYDYQAVRKAKFENAGNWGQVQLVRPRGGPKDDALSESLHIQFDRLAGIDPMKRTREDRLPRRLVATIEGWLDASGADELVAWSHAYLAHAGGPTERARLGDVIVTASKITEVIRKLARVAQAISLIVYGGGRSGAVMPTVPFDVFEELDNAIMRESEEQMALDHWYRQSVEWTAVWIRWKTSW
jgi:hypothetical protein